MNPKIRGIVMLKKVCLFFSFILIHPCMAMLQNTFIAYIPGFNNPSNIAITSNGLYGYVTDIGSNSVIVINTDSSSPTFNTLISAPDLSGTFNGPAGIAITPNNEFAYVCNSNVTSVFVIDTNPLSPTFNSLIAAPGLSTGFSQPASIAITPDGLRAYVTNSGTATLNLIDINPSSPTYNTIIATPNLNGVLNGPFQIVITPNGNYAYVSNTGGSVTVIDTNPSSPTYNSVIAAPGLAAVNGQPEGLAITANGLFAYVSDGSSTDVTVLDINPASPTFNTVLSAPNLAAAFNFPNGVATTSDGNYAYVSNFIGTTGSISSVSVINTNPASPTYNSTLSTPGLALPGSTRFVLLATTPDSRFVYVIDSFTNSVDVIYTGIIDAPNNFTACKMKNKFLMQTVLVNHLTWTEPTLGNSPATYSIYRDAALTQLVATVPATTLQYNDQSINNNYYIVSVDILGNVSFPASTTATTSCS